MRDMLKRAFNRIMDGGKTPEGKVIAVLISICLVFSMCNVAAIGYAVAGGDNATEQELAEQAG